MKPRQSSTGRTKHRGYQLAVLASVFILADAVAVVAMAGVAGWLYFVRKSGAGEILRDTPLPLVIYAMWILAVAGSAAAIVSICLYGFRERWFWRCLVVGACAWLVFPPIHTLIGLVSLVVLLRFRGAFPDRMPVGEPPP